MNLNILDNIDGTILDVFYREGKYYFLFVGNSEHYDYSTEEAFFKLIEYGRVNANQAREILIFLRDLPRTKP